MRKKCFVKTLKVSLLSFGTLFVEDNLKWLSKIKFSESGLD
jgi:hypothetical protein